MTQLRPFYENVQAHYDLSNEFFELFLGPTMMYTCAVFQREDMTLEEAQIAKIDMAFRKCDLQPGHRLLDVGCGWGTTVLHAAKNYGAHAIGLTLSPSQLDYCNARTAGAEDRAEFRLQGWEEFEEPVDRIVAICSIEHFREERYAAFFEKCYRLLPEHAPMFVQGIVYPDYETAKKIGIDWTHEDVLFAKFIATKIFPGGQVRTTNVIRRYAEGAGFTTTQVESLQPHYARTLDCWSALLSANRDRAIALTSEETYDTYMKYLTGCANYFRSGHMDVVQITLQKP